jgi:hypothetical protein
MKTFATIFIVIFSLMMLTFSTPVKVNAQTKKHRLALYLGAGPNYYFNNLEIGKGLIQPLNYSFVGRFMWEPGRLITLGIESGYYQMYTATYDKVSGEQIRISKIAVPIQLVSSIKIWQHYYANFSIGQTSIVSKVNGPSIGSSQSGSWSLADFSVGGGYRYMFKSRISVAVEAKFFYSTKYQDGNLGLVFLVGYKF